jgi:hypothetical protein
LLIDLTFNGNYKIMGWKKGVEQLLSEKSGKRVQILNDR